MHSNAENEIFLFRKDTMDNSLYLNEIQNIFLFGFFLLTIFFWFIYNAFKLEVICQIK